ARRAGMSAPAISRRGARDGSPVIGTEIVHDTGSTLPLRPRRPAGQWTRHGRVSGPTGPHHRDRVLPPDPPQGPAGEETPRPPVPAENPGRGADGGRDPGRSDP